MSEKYIGIFDQKESDTFRPTLEKRIHKGSTVSKTLATRDDSCCVMVENNNEQIRIRRLTPLECVRLMGFDDKDYEAMREAKLSDTAIYHCCGDSIVVNVLENIFKEMLINER